MSKKMAKSLVLSIAFKRDPILRRILLVKYTGRFKTVSGKIG
jgi:hypothetical protein